MREGKSLCQPKAVGAGRLEALMKTKEEIYGCSERGEFGIREKDAEDRVRLLLWRPLETL